MRHKFESIQSKGGLAVHLNQTKHKHRGFGYKTFRILRLAHVNTTNLARAFDVSFDTIKDWKIIDDQEHGIATKERAKKQKAADKIVEALK